VEFLTARPDIVGAVTQQSLLSYWHSKRGNAPLPAWARLEEAPELLKFADNIAYAELVGSQEPYRLLVNMQGARLIESHGGGYMVGRFLDDILKPPYKDPSLAMCHQSITTRLPVYTLLDMRDRNQRIVHFERLLLPFGEDGVTVDGLLVSIEISSPEGPFETRDLMTAPAKPPALALCATIHH
jgi:hypothetical protein